MMRVLYKRNPRTIVLYSGNHSLVFRLLRKKSNDPSSPPAVAVEILPNEQVTRENGYRVLMNKASGCLGLIYVENQVFLAVITGAISQAAHPVKYESVEKIYSVDFISLSNDEWDFVSIDGNGMPVAHSNLEEDDNGAGSAIHPCSELKKLLSNGSFYYSNDFDLTSLIQNRGVSATKLRNGGEGKLGKIDLKHYSSQYMWNSFMMEELLTLRSNFDEFTQSVLDENRFLTTVIRGFAKTISLNSQDSATIISKQSWKRAGTRFNARGIDDNGNVANFVETEFIYNCVSQGSVFSFTQIRGSVPSFWEQDTTLINPKITITRSLEATQPIFNKHFTEICQKYGVCHIVNLLSKTKPAEVELSDNYKHLYRKSNHKDDMTFSEFDFHHETKASGFAGASKILPYLHNSLENFGWFVFDTEVGETVTRQNGVFRTNCLDCLDRTNLIQQVICSNVLEHILNNQSVSHGNSYRERYVLEDIINKHNSLWADNGDAISQIYTGTNALKSSFSRSGKMNFAGALSDVTKSVSRMYQNTFVDSKKQSTMDLLLGYDAKFSKPVKIYDPINDYVQEKLNSESHKFTTWNNINLFVGTYNVSAAIANNNLDLTSWLFPPENLDIDLPDIYAIGIQELIELNAGSILNADSSKPIQWARLLESQLNSQKEQYLLLRTEAVASMALYLFVKKSSVHNVTQVAGSSKKTGLGGISANKGACAVRFEFGSTSFAMVTSHLAAGVNATAARFNDYQTVMQGLKFTRNYVIKDHDHIIWFGDLNYRISMPNDRCRYLIENGAFDELSKVDQLHQEMIEKGAFHGFKEGLIKFYPTYKFDKMTSEYDTSEKQRVPSWTDRVLFKSSNSSGSLSQLNYNSVMNITISDHKPVYSTFRSKVKYVDEKKKLEMTKSLYNIYKSEHGEQGDISLLDDSLSTTSKSSSSTVDTNFTMNTLSEMNLLDGFDDSSPKLPERPLSRVNTLPRRVPPPPASPFKRAVPEPPSTIHKRGLPPAPIYSTTSTPEKNMAPAPPPARRVISPSKTPIGFSSAPLIPSRSNSTTPSNTSSPIVSPTATGPEPLKPLVPTKPSSLSVKANSTSDSTIPTKTAAPDLLFRNKENSNDTKLQNMSEWKPLMPS